MIGKLIIVILVWSVLSCFVVAQPSAKNKTDIDLFIQGEMKASNIPSLSAAIVSKDGVVWKNSYGRQNSNGVASSNDTVYLLSSISKLVVATAIMQQVEKGKLNLDADINKYLSFNVRHHYHKDVPITARMLMTHRAGLANPVREVSEVNQIMPIDADQSLLPFLRKILDESRADFNPAIWKQKNKPGVVFSNSNFGMTLLAHLVEAVSGEQFDSYSRKNIFEPLGMFKTGYRTKDTDMTKRASMILRGKPLPPLKIRIYPAGQLRSSINDWSKFAIAMLNGGKYNNNRILKASSVNQMLEVKYPNANMAYGGGLGLIWRSYGNHQWLGHTGGGGLVTGSMDINPKLGVGVIIFTNAARKFTVSPVGKTYKLLHENAIRSRK